MTRVLAAVLALLVPAGAASTGHAQAVRTIEEAGSGTLKGDPNRRVCREKTVTGSRLKKSKTCRTAREWAELNEANTAAAKQMQRPGGLDGNQVSGSSRGPGSLQNGRPR